MGEKDGFGVDIFGFLEFLVATSSSFVFSFFLLVVAPMLLARDVEGQLEAPPAPPRMERRSWALLMMMMNNDVYVWYGI